MSEAFGEIHVSRRHASAKGMEAEALNGLEALLTTSNAISVALEIRHGRAPGGDPVLSVYRADDGTPVRFASIHLERASGRFYRTYATGWSDLAPHEERHYFSDAHDAAAYVGFLLTRLS